MRICGRNSGLEIIEKFNSAEFPIGENVSIDIQIDKPGKVSSPEKSDLNSGGESRFEKIGFSADLDLCDANVR